MAGFVAAVDTITPITSAIVYPQPDTSAVTVVSRFAASGHGKHCLRLPRHLLPSQSCSQWLEGRVLRYLQHYGKQGPCKPTTPLGQAQPCFAVISTHRTADSLCLLLALLPAWGSIGSKIVTSPLHSLGRHSPLASALSHVCGAVQQDRKQLLVPRLQRTTSSACPWHPNCVLRLPSQTRQPPGT